MSTTTLPEPAPAKPDAASSEWGEEEDGNDLARKYDEINAKTMYAMMEQIGKQKLFFLTNRQAELLSESEVTIDKLIEALELPAEPKLLINLQTEWGFKSGNSCWPDEVRNWGRWEGMAPNRGPFANEKDDQNAISNLDTFMLEVIIPLAERTNALVVMSGLAHHELSASFARMLSLNISKYPNGQPPFSAVAFADLLPCVIANTSSDCHWPKVRRGSKAWSKRHALVATGTQMIIDRMRFDLMTEEESEADKAARKEREKGFKDGWSEKKWAFRAEEMATKREIWETFPHQWQGFDLSRDAPCLIIADSIKSSYDPKNGPITPGISAATRTLCLSSCLQLTRARVPAATDDIFDQKPQLALQNALIKRVSSVLPSLSLKTGGTLFENINDQGDQPWSLFRSLDAMGNGIPVLFLDVVERTPLVSGGSRAFLIEQAKREYLAHQEHLFAHGVVDSFNVCALAHFYDVLFGDGDYRTTNARMLGTASDGEVVPLHIALRRMRRATHAAHHDKDDSNADTAFNLEPASAEQVTEVVRWLTQARPSRGSRASHLPSRS